MISNSNISEVEHKRKKGVHLVHYRHFSGNTDGIAIACTFNDDRMIFEQTKIAYAVALEAGHSQVHVRTVCFDEKIKDSSRQTEKVAQLNIAGQVQSLRFTQRNQLRFISKHADKYTVYRYDTNVGKYTHVFEYNNIEKIEKEIESSSQNHILQSCDKTHRFTCGITKGAKGVRVVREAL